MDPIGNIPLFISILKKIPPKRQKIIILRELLIALGIMVLFNFIGDWLLKALHVSQATVLISGGIILFLIAIKLIFPTGDGNHVSASEKEPFIVPLAIPFVAGPAVLAAVMLYSQQAANSFIVIGAIGIAWLATTIILLAAPWLGTVLGSRGIIACERLMGLVLTMIAVQMFLEGFASFSANNQIAFFQ